MLDGFKNVRREARKIVGYSDGIRVRLNTNNTKLTVCVKKYKFRHTFGFRNTCTHKKKKKRYLLVFLTLGSTSVKKLTLTVTLNPKDSSLKRRKRFTMVASFATNKSNSSIMPL